MLNFSDSRIMCMCMMERTEKCFIIRYPMSGI